MNLEKAYFRVDGVNYTIENEVTDYPGIVKQSSNWAIEYDTEGNVLNFFNLAFSLEDLEALEKSKENREYFIILGHKVYLESYYNSVGFTCLVPHILITMLKNKEYIKSPEMFHKDLEVIRVTHDQEGKEYKSKRTIRIKFQRKPGMIYTTQSLRGSSDFLYGKKSLIFCYSD